MQDSDYLLRIPDVGREVLGGATLDIENDMGALGARQNNGLLLPGADLVRLHTGMQWSEGPVYFPATDTLIFSDIPNHQLLQWVPDLGIRVLEPNSNFTNGNTRDQAGRRISCEHLTNAVVRIEGDGTRTIMASTFEGKRLNSPNDVVVSRDGAIWFTDPTYGILSDREGKRRPSELNGCFVYRIDPVSGECRMVCDSLIMPNGLAFSLDEKTLFIADSSRSHFEGANHHVFAFDVQSDGSLSNQRMFFEIDHGVPDGMRVDEHDNLWCSSGRGVEVIAPNGELIDHIAVPEAVANLTFGGPSGNRLFITATSSLYAITVGVRGGEFTQTQRQQDGKTP